jgi:hypothetical protein
MAENLSSAIGEVAEHITRFLPVYRHALHDPADNGVYEALIRHFLEYSRVVLARHPGLPATNRHVIAQFVSHGFAGAVKAWVGDDSVTKARSDRGGCRLRTALVGLNPRPNRDQERVHQLSVDGVSVLIVEQRARAALEISDHTYVPSGGRQRMEGSPQR